LFVGEILTVVLVVTQPVEGDTQAGLIALELIGSTRYTHAHTDGHTSHILPSTYPPAATLSV